ncbi:hypothetical protein HPB50_018371 [Hyalomma asiaticum]|uniref:Uncharacterized protein n=1 Tax=Hyalomma asiaticum TaxID=266040 RepID=A0ACB7TMD6_HYAAI|nr:hypothetical protein HPB50_018371 [Hyalomma asiaticum]
MPHEGGFDQKEKREKRNKSKRITMGDMVKNDIRSCRNRINMVIMLLLDTVARGPRGARGEQLDRHSSEQRQLGLAPHRLSRPHPETEPDVVSRAARPACD